MNQHLARLPRGLMAVLAVFWLVALAGCGGGGGDGRVLVLGFDGLDPQALDLLISEGRLPHFAELRRQGAYGPLTSQEPLLSPIVWTTIATGKPPTEHGIGHFTAVDPETGEKLPVTSDMRRVAAVWNIFSEQGRDVAVVGWWATWPAEEVQGVIVSDHTAYHFLFGEGFTGGEDDARKTWPASLAGKIEPLIRRPDALSFEELERYVDVPREEVEQVSRELSFEDDLSHFRWALATAESYRDIGLELWRERRPDLAMVYIEGTDSTSHLFGHLFRSEGLAGELAEQQRRYGRAVEEMYVLADEILGEFLEEIDDDTTVVVLSDHGFQLGALHDDPSATRDMRRRVSERFHRLEGVLYLYGRGVRAGARLDAASILDVAPTLLAVAGLPPARDMPGRVLTEGLTLDVPGERVATYERASPPEFRAAAERDVQADRALLERLESLGYIDSGGAPGGAEAAGAGQSGMSSPRGDRNLAALEFQRGDYAASAAIYLRLLAAEPNDPNLQTSLAGALGAMGRFEEARTALDRALALDPINPEALHNLGVVYERLGDQPAAIAQYREALRYAPQYRPSREALLRLTGSAQVGGPTTPGEQSAFALAQEASLAARRADYELAHRLLDQAESSAPRYSLVHRYRANVAYLEGDRARAIESLERALALEPDNLLYQRNLEKLRQEAVGSGP